jgi:hypothetical protein
MRRVKIWKKNKIIRNKLKMNSYIV